VDGVRRMSPNRKTPTGVRRPSAAAAAGVGLAVLVVLVVLVVLGVLAAMLGRAVFADRRRPAARGAHGRHNGAADLHVQAVDGRRVVYPVPGSERTSWQAVHVALSASGVTCLTNEAASDVTAPVFKPCVLSRADTIDGRRNGVVRLELP
jgi:hypothetical protein